MQDPKHAGDGRTRISGHSDDVIVVESKDNSDEFYLLKGDEVYLLLPNGIVVHATFGKVEGRAWNFAVVKTPDGEPIKVDVEGPDEDGDVSINIHAEVDIDQIRTSDQADEPSDRLIETIFVDIDFETKIRDEDAAFRREVYDFIAKLRPAWVR